MSLRKLFVSYARENRPYVDELVRHLDALGYETWVDTALRGGQSWWEEILRQISECDVFTAIVSKNSLNSVACKRELKWALALGKPVLPIAVERLPEALPRHFSVRQIVDYSEPGQEAAFALAGALANLPPAPVLPDPLPEPPAAPLSYLTDLVDQVSQPDPLSHEQQHQILTQLQPALRSADPEEQRGARYILDTFSRREEIYADVGRTLADCGANDQAAPEPSPERSGSFPDARGLVDGFGEMKVAATAPGYQQTPRTDKPQQVTGLPPQRPSRPRSSRWMWVAIGASVLAVLGVVGFVWIWPKIASGHQDKGNAATHTETVPPAVSETVIPSDTETVSPSDEETVPPYSTPCLTVFSNDEFATSAVGSAATSCEFAEAVRFQYVSQPRRGTTVTLDANSPVTGKTYQMTCVGDRVVTCTGGNNALLFLY
ncbi:MAG: TIR domain-containing protein [Candidatus Nanopelagicales bacterium]